jgi:type IV pilus assembly protein PilM
MTKSHIGVDIGTHAIKIVELIQKGSRIEITGFHHHRLPRMAGTNDLISFLQDSVAQLKTKKRDVKLSVSGKDIITRYATFPAMPKSEIVKSLKFEFEKYIPFPIENCIVDLDILEKRPDGTVNVLIVTARKEYIEEQIKLVRSVGLTPIMICIDALALHKLFIESPLHKKNKSYVLLNIGCAKTNLVIIRSGIPVFLRDIGIGGNNFTNTIADHMDIPITKAEEVKLLPPDNTDILSLISIDSNSLVNEIELSIEYARKNCGVTDIESMFISGGSAKFKGLSEYLFENLKVPGQTWTPLEKVKIVGKNSLLQDHASEATLAAGLALT